ncbi:MULTISPECIES: class I SAM-dependent methyltransferase [Dyella]|uniref:Class I SAM-dependent methyltransferase n=2 Tax=Dyella TaxID=231454 RepID=A0A4R0YHF2_9GAMM|nr:MULTISPECIES: class I SAM-dependent methyltransferase [Dyella]TBR37069.1 class I SAM-dependent methyltransferase [Dyella terrae]TCI07842.1 class I SAM-dependent methyltransferase [Dyella soli]
MALDMEKLNEFVGKFVQDFGASLHAGTIVIGEELGLYKAMAEGPATSVQLAERTHTDERYLREWLSAQAASGYCEYDPATGTFSLNDIQAFTLADESSPAYLPGAFLVSVGALKSIPNLIRAFRTGEGYGWHQHDAWLFHGTEKFFRPGYAAHLVAEWIPALDGMEARLKAGARVADVGCGHGASTLLMAQAYPASSFVGYDYHEPSVDWANRTAQAAGLADRVKFEVAPAKSYPGKDYDFVAVFDCLHDMGDPVGASRHVLSTLKPDGAWMIVEPFANDTLQDNINPVGRVFYSASTMICTPASRAQEVGLCLGAQAGEARMRKVVTEGGFSRFRRAMETPFNLIYEARP